MTFKEYIKENKVTYAAFRFSEESKDYLMNLIKELNIPNPVSRDELHTTLLSSRKYLPNYKAKGETYGIAKADHLEIFKSNDLNVLVLILDSKFMEDRHNELMNLHNATYDFPEYKPHITLSYDVGEYKIPDVKLNKDIIVNEEYHEDLED